MTRRILHGLSHTAEYRAWLGMHDRCRSGHKCHSDYYDRGIAVCAEWSGHDGLRRFVEHIGRKPTDDHSVDRVDNNRGYEPGNVRWATRSEQVKNRRKFGCLTSFTDEQIFAEAERRKNQNQCKTESLN